MQEEEEWMLPAAFEKRSFERLHNHCHLLKPAVGEVCNRPQDCRKLEETTVLEKDVIPEPRWLLEWVQENDLDSWEVGRL